jgi:hypothetical protein
MNRSYRIGYNFERRVMRFYRNSCPQAILIRQGKSKFPDLWILLPNKTMAVECKVNKYLSKAEKMLAKAIKDKGFKFEVAYRDGNKLKFWDGCIE